MEPRQTKAQLLDTVRTVRADLERLIAAGEDRLKEPNAFGPWTFADVIAHLTGWRWFSVARMEAARDGTVPVPPWPSHLDPDEAVDEINELIYEANRNRPADEVLRDSRESFDRLEAALAAIPEDDLFDPTRFPWLNGWPLAAVIDGMANHFYEEHAPDIRAWLGGAVAEGGTP
ncbi:ClbS/DfsB family four-helix bundle protein [Sphaerobacter sp.]|uniref:ClbS/DfsB family four-helix bundle protein n=1 Tax=Sphaerobacter sp. TaxID=2099654 RepID=UPI001D3A10FF|nr:ClbS/DfsB family four-helix bundle protein [Sphaerobacter sp.]MBX5446353.1 ClbS/DfsB family four-helix bundle protein [Sphaerobacter sp.]